MTSPENDLACLTSRGHAVLRRMTGHTCQLVLVFLHQVSTIHSDQTVTIGQS